MTAKELLDQFLRSGQQLAQQGKQLAEKGLGIPDSGADREKALSNLGKGAALGGVLALLLGTGMGRRIVGPLVKIGGAAAIGTIAFHAYKKWQADRPNEMNPGTPINELKDQAIQERCRTLIRAMIAAANADGHIDENEKKGILARLDTLQLPHVDRSLIFEEIRHPLDPKGLAALADSPSTSAEIYLTSLLIIDVENQEEREYLNSLANELGLSWELTRQLEADAAAH